MSECVYLCVCACVPSELYHFGQDSDRWQGGRRGQEGATREGNDDERSGHSGAS